MQFKCRSCGHNFESVEEQFVKCPNCKSDNVEPYKPSNMKFVLMFLGTLCVAGITFGIMYFFTNSNKEENINKEEISLSTPKALSISMEDKEDEVFHVDPKNVIKESVVLNATKPTVAKGRYSIEVSCENLPKDIDVKYVLSDSFGKAIIKESVDGKFTSIPASNEEGGIYKIAVLNVKTGEELASKIVAGFVKLEVKVNKIEKGQLQQLINSKSSTLMGVHPSISMYVKLNFTNLKSDEKKPQIFADIFNKFTMGDWESIVVDEIVYNEENRITKVVMTINHVEF